MIQLNCEKHQQISSEQGSTSASSAASRDVIMQIEASQKLLRDNVRKLTSGNEKAAKNLLQISLKLSSNYQEKLFNELFYRSHENMEQELWKNCFHCPIEALKQQCGNAGPHSDVFKKYLHKLITQGITFYEGLLREYEVKFEICFENAIYLSEDKYSCEDLDQIIIINPNLPVIDSMILRSAQRHLIYLGDLHRYKAQNQTEPGKKDYSIARKLYYKAHFLEPINGHPYNQLAVIAFYEKNWIDGIFYYIRALSVPVPFESASDLLEMALNQIRGPALTYEKWILERLQNAEFQNREEKRTKINGPSTDIFRHQKNHKETQNYSEIWIFPGSHKEDVSENQLYLPHHTAEMMVELFNKTTARENQKKALAHLLCCAGILISTIGIEQFKTSSQIAIDELIAFILTNEAILSSAKIFKIVHMFSISVHRQKTSSSQTLIQEQKKQAIEMMFRIFGKLLELILSDLDNIGLYILARKLSKKFLRILPSISFIITWYFYIRTDMPDLADIAYKHRKVWKIFTTICNKLNELKEQGDLVNCSFGLFDENKTGKKNFINSKLYHIAVVLPEFILLSPFFSVIPKQPNKIFIPTSGSSDIDLQYFGVQARFALILHFGQLFAMAEDFDLLRIEGNKFVCPNDNEIIHKITTDEPAVNPHSEKVINHKEVGDDTDANDSSRECTSGCTQMLTNEVELKKLLLSEEELSLKHHWVVEVYPKYLVPDTNTFVDHLDRIQTLLNLKYFTLLVPTIVIDEINCLTRGELVNNSSIFSRHLFNQDNSRSVYIMQRAKTAMEWLRTASETKLANLSTVTSNGNILQRISFAIECADEGYKKRSNDDRILAVCINLSKRLEKNKKVSKCSTSGEIHFQRMVVLLTEDRGLSVKALAEKIPVRTIPDFTKWALESINEEQYLSRLTI